MENRNEKILEVIIREYIKTAQPVGSGVLVGSAVEVATAVAGTCIEGVISLLAEIVDVTETAGVISPVGVKGGLKVNV